MKPNIIKVYDYISYSDPMFSDNDQTVQSIKYHTYILMEKCDYSFNDLLK